MRVVYGAAAGVVVLLLAFLVGASIADDLSAIGLDWWLLVPVAFVAFMAIASWRQRDY